VHLVHHKEDWAERPTTGPWEGDDDQQEEGRLAQRTDRQKKRGGACWGEPAPPQQRWIGGNHCALLIEFAFNALSVLPQMARARDKSCDKGTLPE